MKWTSFWLMTLSLCIRHSSFIGSWKSECIIPCCRFTILLLLPLTQVALYVSSLSSKDNRFWWIADPFFFLSFFVEKQKCEQNKFVLYFDAHFKAPMKSENIETNSKHRWNMSAHPSFDSFWHLFDRKIHLRLIIFYW